MLRSSLLLALFGLLSLMTVSVSGARQPIVLPSPCSVTSCDSTTSPVWYTDNDSRCGAGGANCFSLADPSGTSSASGVAGVDRKALKFVTSTSGAGISARLRYLTTNGDIFAVPNANSDYRSPRFAEAIYSITALTKFQFSFLKETPYIVGGQSRTTGGPYTEFTTDGGSGNILFPVLRLLLVRPKPAGNTEDEVYFTYELILEPYYHFQGAGANGQVQNFPDTNTWTTLDFMTTNSLRLYGRDVTGAIHNLDRDCSATPAALGTINAFGSFNDWLSSCVGDAKIWGVSVGFGSGGDYNRQITTYFDGVQLGLSTPGVRQETMRRLLQTTAQDITFDFTDTAFNGGAFGDPQLVGFLGQSFQVHGIDGSVYNLISSPALQVNAEFRFLSEGNCPTFEQAGRGLSKANTNCFSHPGSYLGAIGILQRIGNKTHTIEATPGEAAHGFNLIVVDGQELSLGKPVKFIDEQNSRVNKFEISWPHTHLLLVKTPEFDMEFDNSDDFVNQRVAVNKPLNSLKSHGLIGQTWNNKKYSGDVKEIEGEVDDYSIDDNQLLGTKFIYSQFQL